MSIMRWNPWDELDRLRRELDRNISMLLGEAPGRALRLRDSGWWPPVDLVEGETEMVLTADLPGVPPEALKVEVREDSVVLEGRVEESREESRDRYWLQERRSQSFHRRISLPAPTDPEKATATFRDGILRVTLPKVQPEPGGRIVPIES